MYAHTLLSTRTSTQPDRACIRPAVRQVQEKQKNDMGLRFRFGDSKKKSCEKMSLDCQNYDQDVEEHLSHLSLCNLVFCQPATLLDVSARSHLWAK